jgi:TRAP-type C4-dicarboxylate transport system permease large subunit
MPFVFYDTVMVFRGVMPFIVADFFRLAVVVTFPVISLIVPQLLHLR